MVLYGHILSGTIDGLGGGNGAGRRSRRRTEAKIEASLRAKTARHQAAHQASSSAQSSSPVGSFTLSTSPSAASRKKIAAAAAPTPAPSEPRQSQVSFGDNAGGAGGGRRVSDGGSAGDENADGSSEDARPPSLSQSPAVVPIGRHAAAGAVARCELVFGASCGRYIPFGDAPLGPGSMFGEAAALLHTSHLVTTVATAATEAWFIPASELRAALEDHPVARRELVARGLTFLGRVWTVHAEAGQQGASPSVGAMMPFASAEDRTLADATFGTRGAFPKNTSAAKEASGVVGDVGRKKKLRPRAVVATLIHHPGGSAVDSSSDDEDGAGSGDAPELSLLRSREHSSAVCVVFCHNAASPSVPDRVTKALRHSLTVEQFVNAQFYQPGKVAEYDVFFVSHDGADAAKVLANQHRYHPNQRCHAFSLAEGPVYSALAAFEESPGHEEPRSSIAAMSAGPTAAQVRTRFEECGDGDGDGAPVAALLGALGEEEEMAPAELWRRARLVHPEAPAKMSWDVAICGLIVYSVLTVTYEIAFGVTFDGVQVWHSLVRTRDYFGKSNIRIKFCTCTGVTVYRVPCMYLNMYHGFC